MAGEFDIIKHFFSDKTWNEMSPYEKDANVNKFKTYIAMLQQGELLL